MTGEQSTAKIRMWHDRIKDAHPGSTPEYWPSALKAEYMEAEILELRAAIASRPEAPAAPSAEGTIEVPRQRVGGYLNYTLRANDGDTRIGGFDISAEKFNAIAAILEATPSAEGPSDTQIEVAAKAISACMDYPWDHMPEQGRNNMRKHAKTVIVAASLQRSTVINLAGIDLAGHKFELRDLLQRAMRNLHKPRHKQQRWVIVRNTFGVGSTVANALCRAFELDPDEFLEEGL